MTRNWEDAKEISQETFLRAFKYLKRFDIQKSFRNWLFQILINSARNFVKKQRPSRRPAEGLKARMDVPEASIPSDPEQKHIAEEFKSRVLECLEDLSLREREIFLLRDIEECSIKESARILGCSSISVRVHLSSARKKIREKIKKEFPYLMERLP